MSDDSRMTSEHETDRPLLRRAERIPLDIVVTATGARTSGIIVAVLASDLDAYEARISDLNNLAASVAGYVEDQARGFVDRPDELAGIGAEAAELWDRTWLASQEFDHAADADEQAGETDG